MNLQHSFADEYAAAAAAAEEEEEEVGRLMVKSILFVALKKGQIQFF